MIWMATLRSLTSLLQHRFTEEAEQAVQKKTRTVNIKDESPRDQATKAAHRAPDGTFYIPTVAIFNLLQEAGRNHKQTGSRRSVKYVVPGAVQLVEETTTLTDHKGKPLTNFEVDSRPVVIPSTKGRIMRHRPRFDEWQCQVALRINDSVLSPDTIYQLLSEGGTGCGLGDYRPQKTGPYGQFIVAHWEQLEEFEKRAA